MLKYAFILFACCFLSPLAAQITPPNCYDCTWVMGVDSNHLDTVSESNTLKFYMDSLQIIRSYRKINIDFTNAAISDSQGNLQFYTNGCAIYDINDQLIQNSSGINAGYIYNYDCTYVDIQDRGYRGQQGTIILPFPNHPQQYYMIHKTVDGFKVQNVLNLNCKELNYTIIDMSLNNGKGKVTLKNQPIIQDTISFGQFTACRHANGRDWWLITAQFPTNGFYKLLLTPDGLSVHDLQNIGLTFISIYYQDYSSQAVFSPDGTKYIRTTAGGFMVYDFDRCSGVLSDYKFISVSGSYSIVGASVSPNSKYFYMSIGRKLFQYDLQALDIGMSKIVIDTFDGSMYPNNSNFCSQQLAPDGKIYIVPSSLDQALHVIEQPNLRGDSCSFKQHKYILPAWNGFSLPNMPNYRLGRLVGSSCDTLATAIAEVEQLGELRVQPNPASDLLHIAYHTENTAALTVAISDYTGKKLQTLSLDSASGSIDINTSALPNGLYLCTLCDSATHRQQSVKFVVMR